MQKKEKIKQQHQSREHKKATTVLNSNITVPQTPSTGQSAYHPTTHKKTCAGYVVPHNIFSLQIVNYVVMLSAIFLQAY
jgi:hypothetical protein